MRRVSYFAVADAYGEGDPTCTSCGQNEVSAVSSTECDQCPEDYFSEPGASLCEECPRGTTRPQNETACIADPRDKPAARRRPGGGDVASGSTVPYVIEGWRQVIVYW